MKKRTKTKRGPIPIWADKIGWKRRVKAVCKPCWELKYCPYGPLVEEFPLQEERDDKSCRIFGHQCPVFFVAEPLTETRELRNISRHIPRPMQFRVLKRDNQICAVCRHSVLDRDIHFDHIIPWSKGGPTEEHNIRLLCGTCNRKRGKEYEGEFLVGGFVEHAVKPADAKFVEVLLDIVRDAHTWEARRGKISGVKHMCKVLRVRRATQPVEVVFQAWENLREFFSGTPPAEMTKDRFEALRERWGFSDSTVRKLSRVVNGDESMAALVEAEADLIRRLGWPVRLTDTDLRRWMRT
jgi:hypothetical protein